MITKFTQTILLLLITLNLIGQDTIYFDSNWKECQSENAEYLRVDIKTETGFQRTDFFVENNQVQMIGNYKSLVPEIKTGIFKRYHKNGQLKHTGEYLENKEIGIHHWFYDNSKTEAIETYSNGKLEGEYKEFYENGNPMSESIFANGVQSGLTKYYRENGSLHSEGHFKNGERNGSWKYYDEKGDLLGTNEFKTEYVIEEAKMLLKLPNTEWTLTEKIDGELTQYYFNRTAIVDKNGIEISPAIMIFVEDASKYESDVTLYSIWKRKPFMEKGIKIEKTLIQEDEDYPLSYKNAYFMKCSYTSKGLDHIFYMIHIITKENKGIQLYLDMTKDIAPEYESEFWTTIKSVRES